MKKFMLIPAPSGYEKEMAYALKDELAPWADDVAIDHVGNVIAKISGTDVNAPRVMVFAHIDQLGFIIRKIDRDGTVQIDRLGGIPEKVLPGLPLLLRSREGCYLPAVIGIKSHHVTPADEKYQVDPITSLFVDLGASSAEEVGRLGIHAGCPAVYRPSAIELAGSRICGSSIDNRGGCAALVRIAGLLHASRPKSDVFLVGSVWEEFNLRGAILAARSVQPAIAICLDVVISGDTPDLKAKYDTRLGAGPAVNHFTFHGRGTLNGTIPHEGLARLAVRAAETLGIPLQHTASFGIITDSAYVQLESTGIATIDLGFPVRYIHSPHEVCDDQDIESLSRLVGALLQDIGPGFRLSRY
jgi:putative aminopeptidase FrvX